MKKKIVMQVQMPCDKCRSKAMKIAAEFGVEKMAIEGVDKNQLVVIGEKVDPVNLTRKLKKNLKHAEIVSVAEEKEKEKPEPIKEENPSIISWSSSCVHHPQFPFAVVYDPVPTHCSIL